jgi:hypothetical protein
MVKGEKEREKKRQGEGERGKKEGREGEFLSGRFASFYKATYWVRPTLMTSFNFKHLLKGIFPKTITLVCQAFDMNFGGAQFTR